MPSVAPRALSLCLLVSALCLGTPSTPVLAELRDADLAQIRQVSERDWLQLRLQVLGLGLSYPAYRVSVTLTDSNQVQFEFWMSTPMAQHLSEAGRKESERILAYHAEGIQRRVGRLLRDEFPVLWAEFDGQSDLMGDFLTPGDELEDPPQRWARWQEQDLVWSWRP